MTTVPSCARSIASVSAFAARVWTTIGRSSSAASASCAAEEAALLVLRVAAVVVVEPRLADGDRLRVVEQSAELGDARRLGRRGLVRVDPERRIDAVVRGQVERPPARVDPRADRDHARDSRPRARAVERTLRLLERVEVRVGVDHATPPWRASSIRGKSGCAGSIPVIASVRPYATLSQATSTGWRSASRIRSRRVGQVRARARPPRSAGRRRARRAPGRALRRALGILRELPRLRLLDMTVETAHVVPDRLERAGDVPAVEGCRDVVVERLRGGGELAALVRCAARGRRRGSGRSSPSSARAGCRGRCRARARSARGSCRA